MARMRHLLGPLIGYHGCDRAIGEAVLAGRTMLRPSTNEYDWLGSGIYFWLGSPERGLEWSKQLAGHRGTGITDPFVMGSVIDPVDNRL